MNRLAHKRKQILQQMELIKRMEYGSLQSETRPSKRNPGEDRGPYYKHQVWEEGENLTRRVPADEVEALALAIDGRKQFEKLAEEFIDSTVAMTRAESSPESKKNATKSKKPSKKKPPASSNNSSNKAPPSNAFLASN